MHPPRSARQGQIGQVRAGDEQHDHRDAEQDEDERTSVSDQVIAVGKDVHTPSGHEGRLFVGNLPGESPHLRARGFHREIAIHACDHGEVVCSSLRAIELAELLRDPDVHVGRGKGEAGPHHADDGKGFVVQRDRPSENGAVRPEPLAPKPVADQDCWRASLPAFLFVEQASGLRLNAKCVECRGRHPRRPQGERLPSAGERDGERPAVRAEAFEHTGAVAPIEIVAGRHDIAVLALRRHFPDAHQPLGLVIWQGLQQHAPNDAEDRCGCTDGERQGADRRQRERGVLREKPQGETDVFHRPLHWHLYAITVSFRPMISARSSATTRVRLRAGLISGNRTSTTV
jgi:hypothetical protein